MFEKEANKWVENNLHSTEEDYIKAFKDGAEFGYNKAIDDVLEVAKGYGLISSEVGFSDLMAYENNEISEDVLWMRFEDNALRELKMAVEDLRQKID